LQPGSSYFQQGCIAIHSSSSGLKSITAAKAFTLRSATVAKVVDIMTLVRFTFSCPLEADPKPHDMQICPRRHSKDLRPWELGKSTFRGALWRSRGSHEDYHCQIQVATSVAAIGITASQSCTPDSISHHPHAIIRL